MKKKKIGCIIGCSILQMVLLVFWAIIFIETVFPIYKWSSPLGLAPQNITVYSPKRVETFLTTTSEKCNNQKFTDANSQILTAFVLEYNLIEAPQHKVLQSTRNTFVYELYADGQPQTWRVSVYFGPENSFDIFVDETGGAEK